MRLLTLSQGSWSLRTTSETWHQNDFLKSHQLNQRELLGKNNGSFSFVAEEESVRTIVFCRQDSINNLFPSPLSVNTTENTEVQLARRTWTQSEFTRSESLLPFMESAGVCGSASCSRRPV